MSLLLALFGGLLTSLSPCVIPLLPLVVGSAGTRRNRFLCNLVLCNSVALSPRVKSRKRNPTALSFHKDRIVVRIRSESRRISIEHLTLKLFLTVCGRAG